MIKKILFILSVGLITLLYNDISFATTFEEEACFELLNTEVGTDARWSNNSSLTNHSKNLTSIKDLATNTNYDLSTYTKFLDNAEKKNFFARRSPISPIITGSNYIVTNIAWGGNRSNFTYPISWAIWGNSYGDAWTIGDSNDFREFTVYVNHSVKGDLLSCWVVHLTPLKNWGYLNISEQNYMTNILTGILPSSKIWGNKCTSGFNGGQKSHNGFDFFAMRANICTLDYSQDDFIRMEVLAIAFNNGSTFFNEYPVFQLQVQAMTDASSIASTTLKDIRDTFLNLVDTRTCSELVHPNIDSLPPNCNRKYSSSLVAFEPGKNLYSKVLTYINNFFPKAEAFREITGVTPTDIEKARGMMEFEMFPYEIYKKLQSIENTTFKNYLLLALQPSIEKIIQIRKDQNIVLSPYEEVFLSCRMDYPHREAVIKDFISKLKDTKNIDFSNLSFSDPKFGDCIIPYPDKSHLTKVIEGSFSSNQLLAEQLNGTYKAPAIGEKINKDMKELAEQEKKLHIDYQNTIDTLTERFNKGEITASGMTEQIQTEKGKLDTNISELYKKFTKEDGWITSSNINTEKITSLQISPVIIIIIISVLLGIIMLIFSLRSYKKKNSQKK